MWYINRNVITPLQIPSYWQPQQMKNFSEQANKVDTKTSQRPKHHIFIWNSTPLLIRSGKHYPTCDEQYQHSDILQVRWPSILLRILPIILVNTQQVCYSDIGSRHTGSKWVQLIIRKTWKLLQGQWNQSSQIKHRGEALDDTTKSTFLDSELIAEYRQGVKQLPPRYKAYLESNLDSLLKTSPTCRKNSYWLIKKSCKTTQSDQ